MKLPLESPILIPVSLLAATLNHHHKVQLHDFLYVISKTKLFVCELCFVENLMNVSTWMDNLQH